jgi:DNA-binding transcriptional regulator YiaG
LTTATNPERDRQRTIDELNSEVQEWQKSLVAALGDVAAGVTDKAIKERWGDTEERLLKLDDDLHPADFDPEWVAEFRGILLASLRSMQAKDPLDAYDDLLLNAEAIRHLLRDAIDGHVEGSEDNIRAVLEQLQRWLPRVSQAELAGLMGISTRQFQRWAASDAAPNRRAQMVARIVALLHRSWTPEGVVAWFYRPRRELEGKQAIDVLDDPAYEQQLMLAVRQGRAQHGA